MKTTLILIFLILSKFATSQTTRDSLENALLYLPDVSFIRIREISGKQLEYDLLIRQPLDHQHPGKGFFNQRVRLTHRGFKKPTVMVTQGYSLSNERESNEVEQILDANNLDIEYRFYGGSMPDSIDWQYLTLEQATADLHYINTLFKVIYKNSFISTGISKGGATSIYYKYFYPSDVALAIPYVAPLDNSLEDKRIYTFLDTIGSVECRQKIRAFQIFLLQHADQVLDKLKWYSKGAKFHYEYTGSMGKSFEYGVLEFPFAFWQGNGDCALIPSSKNLDDYVEAFLKISGIAFFSDKGIKEYEAHYYQALTQSGYYGYQVEPFKKYLRHFTSNPSAIFPPKNAPLVPYDPSLNIKVQNFLAEKGNNILYIYGSFDTWTAAAIEVSEKVNSKRYIIPNTSHITARIKNMPAAMKADFIYRIKQMTNLDADINVLGKKE